LLVFAPLPPHILRFISRVPVCHFYARLLALPTDMSDTAHCRAFAFVGWLRFVRTYRGCGSGYVYYAACTVTCSLCLLFCAHYTRLRFIFAVRRILLFAPRVPAILVYYVSWLPTRPSYRLVRIRYGCLFRTPTPFTHAGLLLVQRVCLVASFRPRFRLPAFYWYGIAVCRIRSADTYDVWVLSTFRLAPRRFTLFGWLLVCSSGPFRLRARVQFYVYARGWLGLRLPLFTLYHYVRCVVLRDHLILPRLLLLVLPALSAHYAVRPVDSLPAAACSLRFADCGSALVGCILFVARPLQPVAVRTFRCY